VLIKKIGWNTSTYHKKSVQTLVLINIQKKISRDLRGVFRALAPSFENPKIPHPPPRDVKNLKITNHHPIQMSKKNSLAKMIFVGKRGEKKIPQNTHFFRSMERKKFCSKHYCSAYQKNALRTLVPIAAARAIFSDFKIPPPHPTDSKISKYTPRWWGTASPML